MIVVIDMCKSFCNMYLLATGITGNGLVFSHYTRLFPLSLWLRSLETWSVTDIRDERIELSTSLLVDYELQARYNIDTTNSSRDSVVKGNYFAGGPRLYIPMYIQHFDTKLEQTNMDSHLF